MFPVFSPGQWPAATSLISNRGCLAAASQLARHSREWDAKKLSYGVSLLSPLLYRNSIDVLLTVDSSKWLKRKEIIIRHPIFVRESISNINHLHQIFWEFFLDLWACSWRGYVTRFSYKCDFTQV